MGWPEYVDKNLQLLKLGFQMAVTISIVLQYLNLTYNAYVNKNITARHRIPLTSKFSLQFPIYLTKLQA